jgi:O-antigen ligase/tetratricopeptide (TPR) repeat protein
LTEGRVLRSAASVVSVFAIFLSFISIIQHFASPETLLWIRQAPGKANSFGPYVNRSHYAGFMGMLLPVVVALLLAYKPRVRYKPLREKMVDIFSQRRTSKHLLLMLGAVIVGSSVFICLSRGGILAMSLSMFFLGALLIRRDRKRGFLIALLFALLIVSVGWFGWDPVFERFGRIRDEGGGISNLRLDIWDDTVDVITGFPVFGAGFGAFEDVYRGYAKANTHGLVVDHAHNDYLELLASGGVLAFALAVWFLAAVLIKVMRILYVRVDAYSVYLSFGAVAGMSAMLIHGLTDFNFHIGANGIYFFFLSGLAVSAAHTRLRRKHEKTYLRSMGRPPVVAAATAAGLLAFAVIAAGAGILMGRLYFSAVDGMSMGKGSTPAELNRIEASSRWAARFDPLEPRYLYARANAEMLLSEGDKAVRHYTEALRLEPLNGEYLQRLGLVFSLRDDHGAAEGLLKAGIRAEARNPAMYRQYASWLLSRDEREAGIFNMKKAISLEPDRTRDYITLMVLHEFTHEEMLRALPETARPNLAFGDFLVESGREDVAEEAYKRAIDFVGNEDIMRASYFYSVYKYYMGKSRHAEALAVMRRAAEHFPSSPGIKITLGLLYEREGITYRAQEEYKKALVLDPRNTKAKERLERLDAGPLVR